MASRTDVILMSGRHATKLRSEWLISSRSITKYKSKACDSTAPQRNFIYSKEIIQQTTKTQSHFNSRLKAINKKDYGFCSFEKAIATDICMSGGAKRHPPAASSSSYQASTHRHRQTPRHANLIDLALINDRAEAVISNNVYYQMSRRRQ
ncbi:hypothetical protein TcasGA2_TC010861 [Tribolium castaneum]|uniref:Uncharacterized protein n=1 Tax=Tribolium castaneum TaxID=7070 RepID=D6W7N9_TRICA|nr:hypothetical protein TcasGA2_TC010861 [Tribolium castaneum]